MELVTPPLSRGDILPGVTRQSILELATEFNEFDVCERFITMGEIQTAAKDGRVSLILHSYNWCMHTCLVQIVSGAISLDSFPTHNDQRFGE